MYQEFRWRGEPIQDIAVWAAERGERIVSYRAWRDMPNMFTGRLEREEYQGTMPESFWHSLLIMDGWHYEEIGG